MCVCVGASEPIRRVASCRELKAVDYSARRSESANGGCFLEKIFCVAGGSERVCGRGARWVVGSVVVTD